MVESTQNTANQEENKSDLGMQVKKLGKDEIEKLEGAYDEDGFYKLTAGGFYDPLGYYYNKDGIDAVGGYYDEEGFYQAPDKTKPFSKKQIESFEGEYDEDNFYRLKAGGFFDEARYYFNKEGKDHQGGYYNNDGFYVEGTAGGEQKKDKPERSRPLDPEEIEKFSGDYDDHDFYILNAGGFYDPHGHYFDAEGFDEIGGYYDENDNYNVPKEDNNDFYGEEQDEDSDDGDEDAASEIDMHVVPVKLWLDGQSAQTSFWFKISGMPSFFTKEKAIQFLTKRIPSIKSEELTFEITQGKSSRHNRWENGIIWVYTAVRETQIGVLGMHYFMYPRYKIKSWLIQYSYDEFDGPGNSVPPAYMTGGDKQQQAQIQVQQKVTQDELEENDYDEEFVVTKRTAM